MADKTPERDPEQENLFKEIDEELRQEKMTVLWKKYGIFVMGAAVLVVGSVAAFQAWQTWDTNRRSAESAQFENTNWRRPWIPFGDHPLKLERYRED